MPSPGSKWAVVNVFRPFTYLDLIAPWIPIRGIIALRRFIMFLSLTMLALVNTMEEHSLVNNFLKTRSGCNGRKLGFDADEADTTQLDKLYEHIESQCFINTPILKRGGSASPTLTALVSKNRRYWVRRVPVRYSSNETGIFKW